MVLRLPHILAGTIVAIGVDWTKILNCVNVVTVISLTLAVVGVVVGVLGWLESQRGVRLSVEAGARERTAQQAASAARQELLVQRAAEDFRLIAEAVAHLSAAIYDLDGFVNLAFPSVVRGEVKLINSLHKLAI
jgi:hypothetical protein